MAVISLRKSILELLINYCRSSIVNFGIKGDSCNCGDIRHKDSCAIKASEISNAEELLIIRIESVHNFPVEWLEM